MADWTKPFEAGYRWMRVSRSTGYETEQLTNLTNGTLTINADTQTFESAEVDCIGALSVGSDLVRCYMDATFEDGTSETVCIGTWLPSVPSRNVSGSYEECQVRLDGRLLELAQDSFDAPVTLNAGTNVISYATGIVTGCGLNVAMADADPGATLSSPWLFGLDNDGESDGGSKLDAVNRLLAMAGFRAASTDPYGTVVFRKAASQPYGVPSWTFAEGSTATFLKDATDERDATDVCNVVLAIYETDAGTIIGTASDTDPDSPYSTVTLGRQIYKKYQYNNVVSQAAANAKAQELLDTNQSVIHRVTIEHVHCGLRVGDIAAVDYGSASIADTFLVRTQEIEIGSAGCLTKSELRRFDRA